MGLKIVVGLGEMMVAEETSIGRQGGGMRRGQDKMPSTVDFRPFPYGVGAPKQEDEIVAVAGESVNGGIRECLPSDSGIGFWGMFAHGQRGIEQKHALTGPAGKVAVSGERGSRIVGDLLEYVDERRGHLDARSHGEAKAVGLTRPVIGILTDYDHLGVVERRGIEGGENLGARGIDRHGRVGIVGPDAIRKGFEIWEVELVGKVPFPAGFDFDVHRGYEIFIGDCAKFGKNA